MRVTLARVEPTEADLRATWQRIRRDSWPGTFEEAMADPLFSRLVSISAMHPPRPVSPVERPAPALPREVPAPAQPPARPEPRGYIVPPPGYVDRKRAASGDRDD